MSSIVEAKNFQSSIRKFTTEIMKQKFSQSQEHFREKCFSSKILRVRKFFWDLTKEIQKQGRKPSTSTRLLKLHSNCPEEQFEEFVGKKSKFSKLYSDCPEELLRRKSFLNGNFLNFDINCLKLTFFSVTKSKRNTAELSKLNSTWPEEQFEEKWFTWEKKLFLSSVVEAKNFQSSNRKVRTENFIQKFSRRQEHYQEECFSSKKFWLRRFFEIWQKVSEMRQKTFDLENVVDIAFCMSGGTSSSKMS